MTTKKEIIEWLRRDKVSLQPISFRFMEGSTPAIGNNSFDALVEASWQGGNARFIVKCKSLSTPKAFQDGSNLLKSCELPRGYLPMLIMPFLRQEQLLNLEQEGISGMDLCGNGIVIVPGRFAVFRGGEKNRFSSSAPIKNIYRKNSSMVSRVFFARSVYKMVQDIQSEINQRNLLVSHREKKPMSLSTVSKALKTLEQDLIISRNDTIRLLQADKLLDKLSENYCPPKTTGMIRLKIPEESGSIREMILKLSEELNLPLVATGISSVGQYAVMQRGDLLSVYCPRLELFVEKLNGSRTDRFPNLEIIETGDGTIYFDTRQTNNFRWSSPIQTYLELMVGDKRDQEIAGQVKSIILNGLIRHKEKN